jgi:hypothetical protein
MAKLTSQVKSDLFHAAVKKLFGDKIVAYYADQKEIAVNMLLNNKKYRGLQTEFQNASDVFKSVFVDERYNINYLEVDGARLDAVGAGEKIAFVPQRDGGGYRETSGYLPAQMFDIFPRRAFQVDLEEGLMLREGALRIDTKELPQAKAALGVLSKRRDELSSGLSKLHTLVYSFQTDKQLEELAPELFALLPTKAKSTALVPIEALTEINQMFKDVA